MESRMGLVATCVLSMGKQGIMSVLRAQDEFYKKLAPLMGD